MTKNEYEQAVDDLLTTARSPEEFRARAAQVACALQLAREYGMRTSQHPLLPGVAGHYGKMEAARVFIACFLLIAIAGIVVAAVVLGQPGNVAAFTSPLSGLAGICLGWLFTHQMPSALQASDDALGGGSAPAGVEAGRRDGADAAAAGQKPLPGPETHEASRRDDRP